MTDDWFEFLESLSRAGARFLVVGAHALAVQGVPRGTQDLDVWIDPTPDNASRVWAALEAFGAPAEALGLSFEDLIDSETVIQFGLPPNRIDLLTAVTGIEGFDEAWRDREEHPIRDLPIPFLGRRSLVTNKRATGRLKDLADLEALGE